jgi:hypothetical protein
MQDRMGRFICEQRDMSVHYLECFADGIFYLMLLQLRSIGQRTPPEPRLSSETRPVQHRTPAHPSLCLDPGILF